MNLTRTQQSFFRRVTTACLIAGSIALSQAGAGEPLWLQHLHAVVPEHAELTQVVLPLLRDTALDKKPELAFVTFRHTRAGIQDPVVLLYAPVPPNHPRLVNPQGVVRDRVGEGLTDTADKLLAVIHQAPVCYGAPVEVRRQQRALQLSLTGDLTLLREQTVEPLHIVGVLPEAERYLPLSLRHRVNAVILSAQLDFGEWRSRLHFVTDNLADAEQVGHIVAAWRDFAGALAAHYAGDEAGARLRQALQASTVTVVENQVAATAAVPAPVVVRAAKEVAGHGGGCPPGGPCDRNKIPVCHKEPGRPQITLCLPPTAVPAHLAHGDTCGPCAERDAAVRNLP
jgi:hypothetical protein